MCKHHNEKIADMLRAINYIRTLKEMLGAVEMAAKQPPEAMPTEAYKVLQEIAQRVPNWKARLESGRYAYEVLLKGFIAEEKDNTRKDAA